MAKYNLKYASKEYFYADTMQWTIPCTSLDVLTEKGIILYESILDKVHVGKFKDTVSDVIIKPSRSGSWFANENHPYYDTYINSNEVKGEICAWNNRVAEFTSSNGEILTSSIIVMHTPDWIYTKSGSLYKIETNHIPFR